MNALRRRLPFVSALNLFAGIVFVLPSALAAQSNYAQPYTFVTLAGNSTVSNVGVGSNTTFSGGEGLALDRAGNVFVADETNDKIWKITPAGIATTFFAVPRLAGAYEQSFPTGVAIDASGNLYIASSGNNAIFKVTPDGAYTIYAGNLSKNPDLVKVPNLLGGYMDNPSNEGYTDGPADQARFNSPQGIALDQQGNVYVTDNMNRAIRKITPQRIVSTLAGGTNNRGLNVDSVGSAFFGGVSGIAIDQAGNVYVADFGLNTIRKITPNGTVSTLAGGTDHQGSADGVGSAARFNNPTGLAVDSTGNIFVADTGNSTIRQISPDGRVTTLAGAPGTPGVRGLVNATGSAVHFYGPYGIAVSPTGILYITDGNSVLTGMPSEISIQPSDLSISPPSPATFTVTATSTATFNYQWQILPRGAANWVLLTESGLFSGTSTGTLTVASSPDLSGCQFRCIVKDASGFPTNSNPAVLTVLSSTASSDSKLVNISTRSLAGVGSNTQIAGFIIQGNLPRKVLIRAGGPYLSQFNVDNVLADPTLALYAGSSQILANDDWGSDRANILAATSKVNATPFAEGSKDSAIVATLQPGVAYTAQVTGKGSANGIAIVEVYDADDDAGGGRDSKVINISTRSFVGAGANIQIGGFILHGSGPKKVLIRAGGPYLSPLGVTNVLADPVLSVFRRGLQIAQNDDWTSNGAEVASACSAAKITPYTANSTDSALVLTLNPETAYTAQVTGKDGATGNALIEIYELP